jgi:MFS family permease
VRSILRGWGQSTSQITGFSAILATPWLLKPVFGLISDFVPLAGTHRKSYLVLTSALTALGLLGLYVFPVADGARNVLLACLLIPTAAVAFADVAADALMVERARPAGLTGRFQAVQWASMYAAGVVAGVVGGELSERRNERTSFLVCGLAAALSLAVVLLLVRERARPESDTRMRQRLRLLGAAVTSPGVLGIGGFLFLWNFNPFSHAVLHLHMTGAMGLSERFFGRMLSLSAVASIVACLAYGVYCRRVAMPTLAYLSIVLGVASTLGYAFVAGERTAVLVTLAVGFTYMTATLIQLDLAARNCPPEVAGTLFALLMTLENLAASLSVWLGGVLYERGTILWGSRNSFRVLIVVGSAITACCGLLVPMLPRSVFRQPESSAS